jgi:hypothetical protein
MLAAPAFGHAKKEFHGSQRMVNIVTIGGDGARRREPRCAA